MSELNFEIIRQDYHWIARYSNGSLKEVNESTVLLWFILKELEKRP